MDNCFCLECGKPLLCVGGWGDYKLYSCYDDECDCFASLYVYIMGELIDYNQAHEKVVKLLKEHKNEQD